MKDKNILVIGYFGTVDNQVDGQTIRTKSIYSLLRKNYSGKVLYFDTQTLKKSKSNYLKLIGLILKSDIIFNIAAQRNLKLFFPILYSLALINKKELNYIAIGGWLVRFLNDKPIHKYMLSQINNLFVQTENLYNELGLLGFKNVHLLNNFRIANFPPISMNNYSGNTKRKIVFMARVHPQKGINTIFKLEKEINTKTDLSVQIDIYGPILESYRKEFLNSIDSSTINYCGVLDPSEIYDTLPNYDLMLFPTKFYTEGFPGSILDSYISGIPVIATEWLNAREFIKEGITGYIVDFNNDSYFISKTIEILTNPEELNGIKKNLISTREKYSSAAAWQVLNKAINN